MKASFFFIKIVTNDDFFDFFAFYGFAHPIEHEINVISRDGVTKN